MPKRSRITRPAAEPAHGYSIDGTPLTDDLIERLAEEAATDDYAERVVAAAEARRVRGSGPSVALHVRVDPLLADALEQRAEEEGASTSVIVRKAIALYLATDPINIAHPSTVDLGRIVNYLAAVQAKAGSIH